MRLRITAITLLTRLVENVGRVVSQVQFFLYGILPVLFSPDELTALTRTYYNRSYGSLEREFRADAHNGRSITGGFWIFCFAMLEIPLAGP